MSSQEEVENLEMVLLMRGIKSVYQHDFYQYAQASLMRRMRHWLAESEFETFSQAQSRILREPAVFESLLQGVTVNVTEMFRDPHFFQVVREHLVPRLKTYPFVKIWVAGCATGEEAYSLAIVLNEAGMQGRYHLYATDLNETVLQQAKEGIFPLRLMQSYTRNYQLSGGAASFADYYTAHYEHAIFMASLKRDISFFRHNLVVDDHPGEMNLVLCRNVMIYFKQQLKDRCIRMFDRCLPVGGFLCLGTKETLGREQLGGRCDTPVPRFSIYRKTHG